MFIITYLIELISHNDVQQFIIIILYDLSEIYTSNEILLIIIFFAYC